jgi:hypothetical protein
MMMIALVDELSRIPQAGSKSGVSLQIGSHIEGNISPCIVSYFFCQSTDFRLNNAVSVLRGLVYLLVTQEKSLIRHVKERYDDGRSRIFEGPNALFALRAILRNILSDPTVPRVYLLVDAFDECSVGLHELLDIITDNSFTTKSKVKWLVASRNLPDIEERLRPDGARIKVSLELNSTHIARAVTAFINSKVRELAKRKQYDTKLEEEVMRELFQKSEATFLWVALACKRLEQEPAWETRSVLNDLPAGLEQLYDRMIYQILHQPHSRVEFCKEILRLAIIAYRPLRLQELVAIAELPDTILDSIQFLTDLVRRCGSFLTIRNGTIYFVHQSAKDYLVTGDGQKIFYSGKAEEHGKIVRRALNILSKTLKWNLCDLESPGTLINDVVGESSDSSLLQIEYACCY